MANKEEEIQEEDKEDKKAATETENEAAEDEPLSPSEAPEEDSNSSKRNIKKILLILIPIVTIIGAGIYFFLFVINAPKKDISHEPQIVKAEAEGKIQLDHNAYLDMEPITVGLSPSGPKREYLRLDLTLRISSEAESKAINEKMPIIRDALIVFLRSLRATDFNSSSSSIYLKTEITKRINRVINPIKVKEVLFQEVTIN